MSTNNVTNQSDWNTHVLGYATLTFKSLIEFAIDRS